MSKCEICDCEIDSGLVCDNCYQRIDRTIKAAQRDPSSIFNYVHYVHKQERFKE